MSPSGANEVCNPSSYLGGNHRCRWPWGIGQPAWDGRRQVQNRRVLIRLKLLSNIELVAAGSLKILKEIVVHPDIRKAITQMGGIELMVGISYLQSKIALMASDKTFTDVHPGADSVRLEQTLETPRGRIPLQAGQVQKGARKKMIIVPIWRWTWTLSLFANLCLFSIF